MIDFTRYITERAGTFTGRTWVFQAIHEWLARPDGSRYFLLTGEPGSGKTAIAAQLAQFSAGHSGPPAGFQQFMPGFVHAVHFCRATASDWIDPCTFARSISLQLAAIPEFARVLKDVGDQEINIDVQVQIDTAQAGSRVTGMHIDNLVIRGLNGQGAFNRLVLDPLRTIYNQGYAQPILLLVDALDEALASATEVTIVDLLAGVQGLPAPVRFILTSRTEPRVENKFLAASGLSLSDLAYASENNRDIADYMMLRIQHDDELASKVVALSPAQIAARLDLITTKASGNFQYVTFFLKAVVRGQRSIEELERLPPGLDGLYADSLERVVRLGKKDWSQEYAPLIGVLSVAQESLTLVQLQAFMQRSTRIVLGYLHDLQQFIETVAPRGGRQQDGGRYQLYHQSMIDFLSCPSIWLADKTQPNFYYLPPDEWHERIVRYYRGQAPSWDAVDWRPVDDYGLLHLARHLYALREQAAFQPELYKLICKPFMREKRRRFGSHAAFFSDLEAVIDLAGRQQPPDIMATVRACLTSATLRSLVTNIPSQALVALARAGQAERAQGYASLIPLPEHRVAALAAIAEALAKLGHKQDIIEILETCLAMAVRIRDDSLEPEAAIRMFEVVGVIDAAARHTEQFQYQRDKRDIALGQIAIAFARAGEGKRALKVLDSLRNEDFAARVLLQVLQTLAQSGQVETAVDLALARPDELSTNAALTMIGHALIKTGDTTTGMGVLARIENAFFRFRAQTEAARAMTLEDAQQYAAPLAEKNLAIAQRMNQDDENRAILLADAAELFATLSRRQQAVEVAQQARRAAASIENPVTRALSLVRCAVAFWTLGDQAQAEASLTDACKTAATLELEPRLQVLAMMVASIASREIPQLVTLLAETTQHEDSTEESRKGPESEIARALMRMAGHHRAVTAEVARRRALETYAAIFAEAGNATLALAVADLITDPSSRDAVIQAVIAAEARAGNIDHALALARGIKDASGRDDAFSAVALGCAELGDTDRAIELAQGVLERAEIIAKEDDYERDRLFDTLALELSKAGDLSRAAAIAERTDYGWHRIAAWGYVAKLQAERGDQQAAQEAGRRIVQATESLSNGDSTTRTHATQALAQAGLVALAEQVCDHIEERFWDKRHALKAIAEARLQRGDTVGAADVLERLHVLAHADPNPTNRPGNVRDVAALAAELGQCDRALALAESLKEDWHRGHAFIDVAKALGNAEDHEAARVVIERALVIAHQTQEKLNAVALLGAGARVLWHLEERSTALTIADEALATAQACESYRSAALQNAAELLAELDIPDKALATARCIDDKEKRFWALVSVARACGRADDLDQERVIAWEALGDIEDIFSHEQRKALVAVVRALAHARAIDEIRKVTPHIDGLHDERERLPAREEVISALIEEGLLEAAAGMLHELTDVQGKADLLSALALKLSATNPPEGLRRLHEALDIGCLSGRRTIMRLLEDSLPLLHSDGPSETAWCVFEAIAEIDGWWLRV